MYDNRAGDLSLGFVVFGIFLFLEKRGNNVCKK